MKDFLDFESFSFSILTMRRYFFYLVMVELSSNATWAQNATTVAGHVDGSNGTSISSLYDPHGITISNDSILYITDNGNNRVVMVDLISSTVIGTIGSGPGSGISQFSWPYDVFITATSLYVVDSYNNRTQKWSLNGTNPSTVLRVGSLGTNDYMFIDKYGNIYLNLYAYHKVIRFAPNSSVPVTIAGNGTAGSLHNQLNSPCGIYVDDNLTLYIADNGNSRIQMWKYGASSGQTVAGNGTSGSNLTQLYNPTGISVDQNGYMYILDGGNQRILRWAPNSTYGVCIAACTGTYGTKANQLDWPMGLAFDVYGSLYVADDNNNRVQKFQILNNQSINLIFS
jgi:sugar lactone lactonase YvrE